MLKWNPEDNLHRQFALDKSKHTQITDIFTDIVGIETVIDSPQFVERGAMISGWLSFEGEDIQPGWSWRWALYH